MNKLFTLFLLLCSVATLHAKKGIVVVHYGTSNIETQALTLDKITAEIKEAMGNDIPVEEAYISPAVRKNLKLTGVEKLSPTDAFLTMTLKDVDTLIVQPTLLIDGGEMEEVRKAVDQVRPFFNTVELGHPVCYTPADFEEIAAILMQEEPEGNDAIIFVGHGNELPSTATYAQLDYMLSDLTDQNIRVSTIEGYPTVGATMRQLSRSPMKIEKVKLVPFLLVCGNHTRRDIAGEYSEALSNRGYKPQLLMRGLAELPSIRAIYISRIKKLLSRVSNSNIHTTQQ